MLSALDEFGRVQATGEQHARALAFAAPAGPAQHVVQPLDDSHWPSSASAEHHTLLPGPAAAHDVMPHVPASGRVALLAAAADHDKGTRASDIEVRARRLRLLTFDAACTFGA